MAVGNIGNMLQHYVALTVAKHVADECAHSNAPVEYIDCYSMAPWETITGKQPQGFVGLVRGFENKSSRGDFVSSVFLKAWNSHYGEDVIPTHPNDREYPNTAVLLTVAFPHQRWNMRLHENDLTEAGKQAKLKQWLHDQKLATGEVNGDWQMSRQIMKAPVSHDSPVIVMLDPFRIVPDGSENANKPGYLKSGLLRMLMGEHALKICCDKIVSEKPLVVLLLSYSDVNPLIPDRIVRNQFSSGWHIQNVRSGPWKLRGIDSYHQCWVVSRNLKFSESMDLQSAWDSWSQVKAEEANG